MPVTTAAPSDAAVLVATLTVEPSPTVPVIVWLVTLVGLATAFIDTGGATVSSVIEPVATAVLPAVSVAVTVIPFNPDTNPVIV